MQALRAFEAAAREKSLTRAAEALHLTHGAISHQIKSLEEDLGVRLVERAGRGIRLTDEGERFALRVRAAFSELAAGVQELSERANPRTVRVSSTPSFTARWLLPRIGRFVRANPNLDLDIHASNTLVDFHHDNVDFAIRYGFGHWPGVTAEYLIDDSFFPVCSPRIAGGVPKSPSELARYTLLRTDDEYWRPWFQSVGLDWPEPARGTTFNDSSHLMQAAVDGQGIALARRSLVGNDLRNGLLVKPFAIEVPSPRRYYLVYLPKMAESPKLAALRRWLHDELAAEGETLATPLALAPGRPLPRTRSGKRVRTAATD